MIRVWEGIEGRNPTWLFVSSSSSPLSPIDSRKFSILLTLSMLDSCDTEEIFLALQGEVW